MSAGELLPPQSTVVDLTILEPEDMGVLIHHIDMRCAALMDILPFYRQAVAENRPDDYPEQVKALHALRQKLTFAIKVRLNHLSPE